MDPPNQNQFTHYYSHQQHQHHHHHQSAAVAPAPNGLLPNNQSSSEGALVVYPLSVPSAVSTQLEPAKRKRGRPRKYGTPEQALAAKKATSSLPKDMNDQLRSGFGTAASASSSSKKSHLDIPGHAGQGFAPHVINAVAGEDLSQKILLFSQQNKREICVLSASGSIFNPSLRQPATSGGNITYEGQFEIISLSGCYVHDEVGGRSGGLSVCLSSTDGQIVGGVVAGTLTAAGPVQIILGTFLIGTKDTCAGVKGGALGGKYSSVVGGASVSSLGFQSVESSRVNPFKGENDDPTIGGNPFMIQSQGMHMAPWATNYRSGSDARDNASYDFTDRMGHEASENGELR